MVFQPRRRASGGARRDRRRARAYSGGDRFFDHFRRRSPRRAVRVGGDRDGDLLRRRPRGDDLGGDCRGSRGSGSAGARTRCRVSAGRHDPDGPDPVARRFAQARSADAIRLAFGHHRVRQRARDPDLHGAIAATDRGDVAQLRARRGRPRHHLSAAASHQGGALPARRHRRAGDDQHCHGPAGAYGGRHGSPTPRPSGPCAAARYR